MNPQTTFLLNLVECESFLESKCPDIFALCKTNLDDSINSVDFFVKSYLPLIRKDSFIQMHGFVLFVKEGLLFVRVLSLENSAGSYLCFRLALRHSVSYFFFLYQSHSSSLNTVFDICFIQHRMLFSSLCCCHCS